MTTTWKITDARVVPKTDDIVMKDGGRRIDATYAYADLAGSTKLVQSTLYDETVAKIIRAYINSATRIFREYGGEIRSFDGDRVMAIFIGDDKNRKAVRAAFAINWAVQEVIPEAIEAAWSDGKDFKDISHRVGIDTGESLIVRGGARNNSDLISVGSAPNVAAKLSDLKEGYSIYITKAVHEDLDDELIHFPTASGRTSNVWSRLRYGQTVGDKHVEVYGSHGRWGV
ncbi:adenylate/guanylate cyclase domain-containing protein [Rhodococcus erythropolis]|uniref:adenylate/guanylate cyclase domain-containing protein n=2 Tax=Nocardiaceae TaxID=85025 RepID=UPI001E52C1D7|nr:adenylate/guanylate cyclase domain-containing protein [Rhodococcus erythropolis]